MTECLACKGKLVAPLYNPGPMPLFALNLARSRKVAKDSPVYPMNFYVCNYCGHVFNSDFDYAKLPYEDDSNLMYNQGAGWAAHMSHMAAILSDGNREGKTVIDIGAGDGGFLDIINQRNDGTRCIAFEPGVDSEKCSARGIETYADYFIPQRDIRKFKPDILVCRHVLEHLQAPRDFVAEIAYYANMCEVYPTFIAEVPCITKALDTHRITDFLYEHVSNFTQRSLQVMLETAGWHTNYDYLAYNGEVAVWVGHPKHLLLEFDKQAKDFRKHSWDAVYNVRNELKSRRLAGKTIAFWGGTGKSAAFLNTYRLDGDRVVDSDIFKVGRYVPGTGQEIEDADALLDEPVDVIVITTRWRAADIYSEIKEKGILYDELLILEGSDLCEYTKEKYREDTVDTR